MAPQLHQKIDGRLLFEGQLDVFVGKGLAPEICLNAQELDDYGPNDFASLARALDDAGLARTVHGPFVDLQPASNDRLVREAAWTRLAQMIDAVRALRPASVVCHAGFEYWRHQYDPAGWTARSAETWTWVAGELEAAGTRLMLENTYERTPGDILALFEALPPSIGFCFDIGHQHGLSRASLADWLDALGHRLGHVHLHDNLGNGLDEHLVPGQGTADFAGLRKRLHALPPVAALAVEVHWPQDSQAAFTALERMGF